MHACLKLFREDNLSEYNDEIAAYSHLNHAGVEYHIPKVYGVGRRTLLGWGIDTDTNDTKYYGILMEWLDGERLTRQNITTDHAITLVTGLSKIHEAGVLHCDIFDRNILIIPNSKRAVWIDFSSAQTKDVWEKLFPQEMYLSGGLLIGYVFFCFCSGLIHSSMSGPPKMLLPYQTKNRYFYA